MNCNSPAKPWETDGNSNSNNNSINNGNSNTINSGNNSVDDLQAPKIPERNFENNNLIGGGIRSSNPYYGVGGYNGSYGVGGYGMGGYNGGYNGGYSGGYSGAYSGGYGSYGTTSGYGGGGYYGNRFGGGNFPPTSNNQSFKAIEQIVFAFSSLAQMIDSTVYATYSSFMSVVGVVEQFRMLQGHFGGQLLSVFAMAHALKRWLSNRITGFLGLKTSIEDNETLIKEFTQASSPNGKPLKSSSSASQRREITIFLIISALMPLLFAKLWSYCRRSGSNVIGSQSPKPSECDFAKALYSFHGSMATDLSFAKDDIIAILDRSKDPNWWYGRLQNGAKGYFPSNHVTLILKRQQKQKEQSLLEE